MNRGRRLVTLSVVLAVMVLALPAAALWNSFGDTSWWLSTPLDENGERTVCAEGFDFTLALSPNEVFEPGIDIGSPTGFTDGEPVAFVPVWQLYPADQILVDNGDGTYGGFLPNLGTADAGDGTDRIVYTDSASAPDRLGLLTTEAVYDDEYFAVDGLVFFDGTPRPVAAIGTGAFAPASPLPVGDIAIVGSGLIFDFVRVVEAVPCTTDVDIDAKPYGKDTKVKPGNSKIKVAVLADGSHDLSTLENVTAGTGGAEPLSHKEKDVDGDGDLDVEFVFDVAATGIACGDTSVTLQGAVDGLAFQSAAAIVTKC